MFLGCLGIAQQTRKTVTAPAEGTESPSSSLSSSDQFAGISRIRLSDGRHLAYRERGVPKNKSNYKVIIVHGFGSSKEMNFLASQVMK